MLVGAVVALIPGDILAEDSKEKFVAVIVAFLVGQGVADHGKEAIKAGRVGAP